MVKLLNIAMWENVIVGYDHTTGIIILKRVDPEEYGSVAFRKSTNKQLSKERMKNTRIVYIKHLINMNSVNLVNHYRAECNGIMIFLEAIKQEENK